MTRNVFSNDMVAHVWAQQKQESGRSNNGNFWFEGATIYSYRTPIARIVETVDGRRVVLRTSETFSITTSGKHENAISYALRGNETLFVVPSIAAGTIAQGAPDHVANLAHLIDNARRLAGKVKTARFDSYASRPVMPSADPLDRWNHCADSSMPGPDGSRPLFLETAAHGFRAAAEYAAAFGLPFDVDGEAEIAAANAAWRERWQRYNSPAAVRKREKAALYRERARERAEAAERARQRESMLARFAAWKAGTGRRPVAWQFDAETDSAIHAELTAIETAEREQAERDAAEAFALWRAGDAPRPHAGRYVGNSPEIVAMWQAVHDDEARERFEREAATRAAWLNGEPICFYGRDEHGGALLRLRGDQAAACEAVQAGNMDGLNVETSQGGTVPLAHAVRAFQFKRLVWQSGKSWERNGQCVRVGHFQIDRIDAESGDVKAGCHVLRREEIERLAASIGLGDLAPSDEAAESRPGFAA
jgi:hypothetical protein